MSEQSLTEAYLRADQAYRLAYARALLNHADLEKDLRAAQAELDVEDRIQERLEALIALENLKERTHVGAMTAVENGWKAALEDRARRESTA